MSDESDTRGVHVSSGEGIVAHLANLTAFAHGDDEQLNELLVRLNALKDAPWHEVVRTLTAGIVESNYDSHPHLACVSIDDDRVAALVFGDTSLVVHTDQHHTTLNGRDSSTWIDVAVHGSVEWVRAGRQSNSVVVGVLRDGVIPAGGFLLDTAGPMPSSTRWVDQDEESIEATPSTIEHDAPSSEPATGTSNSGDSNAETAQEATPPPVPTEQSLSGIFARLDERHRSAEPSTIPAPSPTPAADQSADTQFDQDTHVEQDSGADDGSTPPEQNETPTTTPAETNGSSSTPPSPFTPRTTESSSAGSAAGTLTPARPQLRGVRCPSGHLTKVNDQHCRTCGESVDPEAVVEKGDRPVLGLLTFDDGAVLSIDRPAAIGSDVPTGYEIDGEPATIVRLDDGLDGVSDVQVEIHPVGWDVEIHDMNSSNGTYTVLRGERQTRTRLRGGQSVVLQDGMMVEVGGRNFTYTLGADRTR